MANEPPGQKCRGMIKTSTNPKWISDPDRGSIPNFTFLARKSFMLPAIGTSHVLSIAADSQYILYLNGKRLGCGPARSSQMRYFYDSYRIDTDLRIGENHLAVEVHCPVTPTYTTVPIQPALWLQIDDFLVTDATWQVRRDVSRRNDVPLYTFQMGYCESRDLRREIQGWKTFCDDSKGWLNAEEIAATHDLGGRNLVPRDIPFLREEEIFAEELVASGAVPHVEAKEAENAAFADLMHAELHFQAKLPKVELRDDLVIVHPSSSGRGAYCVFDFHREMIGLVRLRIDAPRGTILDVGYGESLCADRLLIRKSDYHFADRYILEEGVQDLEGLHDRGFRYLQLVFRCFDRPVTLHEVKVLDRRYPIPSRATFQCDDDFLNRLWEMCGETLSACSLDTLTDCPWREQALWLNDMLVTGLFYSCLTGDKSLTARSLRIGADGQGTDGIIPVTPPSQVEMFSSMSALAAITLRDYYLYTGDLDLVRELMPKIDRGLAVYRSWRNETGLVADQDHITNFIDWAYSSDTAELGGTTAVLNLLIAAGFQCAAELHASLGEAGESLRLHAETEDFASAVCEVFWDRSEGRLVDCTNPPLGRRSFSQHSHAVGVYFDLLPEAIRGEALEALFDPSLIEAELYFQHFVLGALAKNGFEKEAAEKMRELWGEMVEKQSATVWEAKAGSSAFEGCGSLCHAFSCTPLYFMQTVLLGIRPLLAGFEEFEIDPRPLDLAWCKGTVPTPHGFIEIEWTNTASELELVIVVPNNTAGILRGEQRIGPGRHTLALPHQVAELQAIA
jgi:alpha-L-rhamnosidase